MDPESHSGRFANHDSAKPKHALVAGPSLAYAARMTVRTPFGRARTVLAVLALYAFALFGAADALRQGLASAAIATEHGLCAPSENAPPDHGRGLDCCLAALGGLGTLLPPAGGRVPMRVRPQSIVVRLVAVSEPPRATPACAATSARGPPAA